MKQTLTGELKILPMGKKTPTGDMQMSPIGDILT